MAISFACPSCEFVIKTRDEFAGRKSKCPQCSNPVTVPAAVAIPQDDLAANNHEDNEDDEDDDDEDEDGGHEGGGGLLPHKDHPHEDLIDMTPMVDIVFFLLIFFLTTSMTALQAVMNLPNPQKATDKGAAKSVGEMAQDSDTLMVMIQEDDTFWIDDEQCFSDQDLRMKIQAAVADSGGKPLTLVVVGAADASHGAAIRAFDAGAAARVGNISLLVKEELDDGK
jgi:biopolymer transport protein ExbD